MGHKEVVAAKESLSFYTLSRRKSLEAVQRSPTPPNFVSRSPEADPGLSFPFWCEVAVLNSVNVLLPGDRRASKFLIFLTKGKKRSKDYVSFLRGVRKGGTCFGSERKFQAGNGLCEGWGWRMGMGEGESVEGWSVSALEEMKSSQELWFQWGDW